jgi:hypothetical protein
LGELEIKKTSMSEVSVKLIGGLGNYMFQIAAAYAYSLKHGKQMVLTTDDSIVIHKHLNSYKDNILSNITFITNKDYKSFKPYNEPGFEWAEIPAIEGDMYLNGYFQSEKYFKEYSDEIKKLFEQPTFVRGLVAHESWATHGVFINTATNTCSIHVRRGDYLKSPDHHPAQNMNYYMKAIKQMPKDTIFFVFSDDIPWCKQNFPDLPEKFKFVEGNPDFVDLHMMSSCKNNIICNSTFSWWAAWLNKNPDKKVIIPKNWFGPAYAHYNTEDLYCENWLKI